MFEIKTFADPKTVASQFAEHLVAWSQQPAARGYLTAALSGGSTPKLLFSILASEFANRIDWSRIHFFWGDERCVPPTDPESNYGVVKELLFDRVSIPEVNIHRVHGESDPQTERVRYAEEILKWVEVDRAGVPCFDLMLLGMGDDGHTASIFPDRMSLLSSSEICAVAVHPQSGQKRITMTGPVLNASAKIVFLITGASKAPILAQIVHRQKDFESFPAAHIRGDRAEFYLDQAAAAEL